jgi:hypothetical protein
VSRVDEVSAKAVEKALKKVGDLIERVRVRLSSPVEVDATHNHGFTSSKWGSLQIDSRDEELFREARAALISIATDNPDRRVISRDAIGTLLRDVLLRSLLPGRGGHHHPRPRFELRKKKQLRRLRKTLLGPLREWRIAAQVTGLSRRLVPTVVGRVQFMWGSSRNADSIAAETFDFDPDSKRAKPKSWNAQSEVRLKRRLEVTRLLTGEAIAVVRVAAADAKAAKHIGTAEIRRTIDLLNFFAPAFEDPRGTHRAYLAPESLGGQQRWVAYDPATWAYSYNDDFVNEFPLEKTKPTARRARRVGLHRANELLAKQTRTDLEDRIVNALAWAGRARTERRREQAFLLYAIALEALLTKPGAHGGITERLKFRTAHLVHHKRAASRRRLAEIVERLYRLRSVIVHNGIWDELADEDLRTIALVAELVLVTVLTKEPFKSIRDAGAFEAWFEARQYGG